MSRKVIIKKNIYIESERKKLLTKETHYELYKNIQLINTNTHFFYKKTKIYLILLEST